jgi:hypothetical protein
MPQGYQLLQMIDKLLPQAPAPPKKDGHDPFYTVCSGLIRDIVRATEI